MKHCLSTHTSRRCAGLALLIAMVPAAAIGQNAAAPAAAVSGINAGMNLVVAADGSVASVAPDADLPEPIRAGLIKRVLNWHYEVPKWEGRAVSLSTRQGVRLQLVPTTSGGYAVRVMEATYVPDPDPHYAMAQIQYPKREAINRVSGTVAYVMRIDVDGRLNEVRRIYPEGKLDRSTKAFDAAVLASLEGGMRRPVVVDGVPISCEMTYPIVFTDDGAKAPEKVDLTPLEVGMRKCPGTALKTKIEGSLL